MGVNTSKTLRKDSDTHGEELDLPLAQEVHESLRKIDVEIAGSDQILGMRVDKYPAALPLRKLILGM